MNLYAIKKEDENLKTKSIIDTKDFYNQLNNDEYYKIFCYFIHFIENNLYVGNNLQSFIKGAIKDQYVKMIAKKTKLPQYYIITLLFNFNDSGLFDIYFKRAGINLQFNEKVVNNINYAELKNKFVNELIDRTDKELINNIDFIKSESNNPKNLVRQQNCLEDTILYKILEYNFNQYGIDILMKLIGKVNSNIYNELLEYFCTNNSSNHTGSKINKQIDFLYLWNYCKPNLQNLLNKIKNIIEEEQKINDYSSYFDNLFDEKGAIHIIDFDAHDLNKRDAPILTYSIKDHNKIQDYVVIGEYLEHHSDLFQRMPDYKKLKDWDPEYLYGHTAIIDATRATRYSDDELINLLLNAANNKNIKINKIYKYESTPEKMVTRLARLLYRKG